MKNRWDKSIASPDSSNAESPVTPTVMSDTLRQCCHRRFSCSPFGPVDVGEDWHKEWERRERIERHNEQGHANYDKAAGDFDLL